MLKRGLEILQERVAELFIKNDVFPVLWLLFQLFCTFAHASEYIDPSGNFVFNEILYSSNFFVELHLDDVLEFSWLLD